MVQTFYGPPPGNSSVEGSNPSGINPPVSSGSGVMGWLASIAGVSSNYSNPSTSVSVGTTSTLILAGGTFSSVILQSSPTSTGNVYLHLNNGTAVVNTGIFIPAGGGSITFGNSALKMPLGSIFGISDSGNTTILIQGVV